tara:strand:- start:971 stop:1258 length:288 start_codon:yes stop_codon:yes gene_type:complete
MKKEWQELEDKHMEGLTDDEVKVLAEAEGILELADLSKLLHQYLTNENQPEFAFITTLLMGKVIQLTLSMNEMKNLVEDELLKLALQMKNQPFDN